MPGFLDFTRVFEDPTGAEPAERRRSCFLPRAASSDLTEPALHVADGQERTPVVIEGLELVLLEPAQEMCREGVHDIPMVAGQFLYVRNERTPSVRTELRAATGPNLTTARTCCFRRYVKLAHAILLVSAGHVPIDRGTTSLGTPQHDCVSAIYTTAPPLDAEWPAGTGS